MHTPTKRYQQLAGLQWPNDTDVTLTLLAGEKPCLACGRVSPQGWPICRRHAVPDGRVGLVIYDRWLAAEYGLAPQWAIRACQYTAEHFVSRGPGDRYGEWRPKSLDRFGTRTRKKKK